MTRHAKMTPATTAASRKEGIVMNNPIAMLALAATLMLAGCGGGGSEIASAPPPVAVAPAPTPAPTPAPARLTSISIERVAPLSARAGLTAGTFDTKAIHSDGLTNSAGQILNPSQILAPGTVRLGIDPASLRYTVTASVAGFPVQESFDFSAPIAFGDFNPIDRSGFGHRVLRTERYSDGSTQTREEDIVTAGYSSPRVPISGGGSEERNLYLGISFRYVTLGSWNRDIREPIPAPPGGIRLYQDRVLFVQGIRTQPADIPTSGTATYQNSETMPFSLQADFGARRIGTEIQFPFYAGQNDGNESIDGLSARGSAAITSAGDFLIPLNGSFIGATGATTAAFTGTIDGAFFGPQAAEVGGVFQTFRDGVESSAGSFAAAKAP